jgi:hypothetical protein
MKQVQAIITNVDKTTLSESCLAELKRSGIPEGKVITGTYRVSNKSVEFRAPNGDHCVAWVDSTCKILERRQKDELKPGMVFFPDSHPDSSSVIIKLYKDEKGVQMAMMEHLRGVNDRPDRFSMGSGWFEHTYAYERTMPEEEFEKYRI